MSARTRRECIAITRTVCALLLCFGAVSCGADPAPAASATNDPAPAATVPPTAATGPFPITHPSQVYASLHGAKQASSLLTRDADDYVEGYGQHVGGPLPPQLIFGPQWADGYSAFDTVAFAVYRFDLTGRQGKLSINTQWTKAPGDYKLLWLGASNWQRDRWDWYSGEAAGAVQTADGGMDIYRHPDTGEMYVAVVLLGQSPATLNKVWLTCSMRGDWWMYGRNATHQARSQFKGPDYPTVKWQLQFATQSPYLQADVGSPVYDANGVIYVGTQRSELTTWEFTALNPDGTQRWMHSLVNIGAGGGALYGMHGASAALGDDGTLYAAPNLGALSALNPGGTVKWTFSGHDLVSAFPAIGPDGTIYAMGYSSLTPDFYLHALNPDGTLRWEHQFEAIPVVGEIGIAADGTVYACHNTQVWAFTPDGAVKWTYQAGESVESSMPVVDSSGNVYVTTREPKLHVLNPDGTLARSWLLPAWATQGGVTLGADGAVYVTCADAGEPDGRLYAYNADGALRWSYSTAGRGAVTLDAAGTVYVAGSDSRLYAINADGTLKWWFVATYSIYGSPVIGEDGTLYVLDAGGMLYALGPGSQMAQHTASGYVKDEGSAGIPGVTVTLSGEEPVVTDTAGFWSRNGLADGTYLVSASRDGYNFSPGFELLTIDGGDTTVADFTGVPIDPPIWQMEGLDRAHTRRSPHTGPATPALAWHVWLQGEKFRTEPLIRGDGALVLQSKWGWLIVLNPDGTLRWRCAIGLPSMQQYRAPALVMDSTALCVTNAGPNSILYALTPGGAFKWTFAPVSWPYAESPVITNDGSVLLRNGPTVLALDPAGAVVWSAATDAGQGSPAIAADGTMYFGGGNDAWALNADGSVRWTCPVEPGTPMPSTSFTSAALAGDGTIYLGFVRNFYALNPDGTVKWVYHTGDAAEDEISFAPALGPDGSVYFTTQKLIALDADGALQWEFFPDGNAQCAPPTVDAAGTVYSCVGLEGAVHALNPDGSEKWVFDTSSDLGAVAIGADGTLYFANDGGDVYALGPGTP